MAAAARLLGTMALSGEFGDVREAMQWFHMAANKGDGIAMANIAILWAQGLPAPLYKSCDFAREFAQKAIAAGYEKAKEDLQSGFGGKCQW